MKRQVILHIGLHKTGTRFLQRMVFRQLEPGRFNVDPPVLWQALRTAVRNPDDAEAAAALQAAVDAWHQEDDGRTLILSEPHICGDMYSGYHDYAQNLALMKRCFPEAEIIYFVRKQSDWLHSAYRQHLARGKPVPIEVFLNFYEGEFRPRLDRHVYGSRNLDALQLRFLDIYRDYAEAYGEEHVHLFRQEDLRSRGEAVKGRLASLLGLEKLPTPPRERTQNRSFSALAIKLFFPETRRPYPPPTAADIGLPRKSRLSHWFRLKRIKRTFVQHVFDKLIYRDWDLLARGDMRAKIEAHYAEENAALERIAGEVLARETGGAG